MMPREYSIGASAWIHSTSLFYLGVSIRVELVEMWLKGFGMLLLSLVVK